VINKRFFSTPKSQSPLNQEIKYDLKEFLRDYEAHITKNQEVLKESLQQCLMSSVNNLKDSQNNFKESVKVHIFLYNR
jgi:hypothetical protein